jgi:hypothetical protein
MHSVVYDYCPTSFSNIWNTNEDRTLISTSEMLASILYHILELIYSKNPHFIRFQNYGASWMKPNYNPIEQHLK